jgi:microcystin-dependent protein
MAPREIQENTMDAPFIAMIVIWSPNFAPQNWSFCAGQSVSVQQNQALFALIGTTYGGNGSTTFNLPDLRGRLPLGAGQAPGLSFYSLGEMGGTETTALTVNNMPMHTHSGTGLHANTQAWATPGTDHNPSSGKGLAAAKVGAGFQAQDVFSYATPSGDPVNLAGGMVSGATSPAGGSMPFGNMQPFISLNFIIAMTGLFPQRP